MSTLQRAGADYSTACKKIKVCMCDCNRKLTKLCVKVEYLVLVP